MFTLFKPYMVKYFTNKICIQGMNVSFQGRDLSIFDRNFYLERVIYAPLTTEILIIFYQTKKHCVFDLVNINTLI